MAERPPRPRPPKLAEARLIAGYLKFWRVLDRLVRAHVLPVLAEPTATPERRDARTPRTLDELKAAASKAVDDVRVAFAKEVDGAAVAELCAKVGGQIDAHNHLQQSGLGRVIGVDIVRTDKHIARELPKWTAENTALIRRTGGLNDKACNEIGKVVRDGFEAGTRHETIAAQIEQRLGVAKSRAVLIARDQTNKLNGQLTADRQVDAGVTHYVWSSARDERVRPSHRDLEGQVIAWADAPPEGHPGAPIQCRCVAIPTIVSARGERRAPLVGARGGRVAGAANLPAATVFNPAKQPPVTGAPAVPSWLSGKPPLFDPTASPAVQMPATPNAQAIAHRDALRQVPQELFDEYAARGGKVEIVNGPVTDAPSFAAYKSVQPSGHPPGSTWAQLSGGYSPSDKVAVAGSGNGFSGSGSVALHELAHGIDELNRLGVKLSDTPDFDNLHAKIATNGELLAANLGKSHIFAYCTQVGSRGREEAFAELLSTWFADAPRLRIAAPSATQYFEKLFAMRLDEFILTATSRPARVDRMDAPVDFWATAHLQGQTVLVLARAEGPRGEIADGMLAFNPGDPDYELALSRAQANERRTARALTALSFGGDVDAGEPG